MRIGIFFGGPSREREISFAGGRTVYDNLDKSLFEPVPIFIDSMKNFILLDWHYIYKGTIRDFYPPTDFLPRESGPFQLYVESLPNLGADDIDAMISQVGKLVLPQQLAEHIDFAFLALHGIFGEDGQVQGMLESLNIPYSGSGVLPSAIGMNKAFQKKTLKSIDLPAPQYQIITRRQWQHQPDRLSIFKDVEQSLGTHLVVKPSNQGSSVGVSILDMPSFEAFEGAVSSSFFIKNVTAATWNTLPENQRNEYIRQLTDIREGLGLPIVAGCSNSIDEVVVFKPNDLIEYLNSSLSRPDSNVRLQALDAEKEVVIESFIDGKEFSCIVIRGEDGEPIALPPTQIIKGGEVFDYRSKYLPGLSRKVTPIDATDDTLEQIRKDCVELFNFFGFDVYARIDGFIGNDGKIYLNDPNTTSGMLPSSFFFHQAAEIGMNPSQFLTYIIRTSLDERLKADPMNLDYKELLNELDNDLILGKANQDEKKRIAVIMGGYSSERHISVESGRNIYEKLAASEKYEPIPVFLTGSNEAYDLYQIPVNMMLKDNADDIAEKIRSGNEHPVLQRIRQEASSITEKYCDAGIGFKPELINFNQLASRVDGVFIALHGRPGEDGAIQKELEKVGLPYNGSGVDSSSTTINKFETNQLLKQHGFLVAQQFLVEKSDFLANADKTLSDLENLVEYPLIAKPVDDGCSSAVKKINDRHELAAFLRLLFREEDLLNADDAALLHLKRNEEFSKKDVALIENFIEKGDAKYFMEITGGMLSHWNSQDDDVELEVFEPSEALAGGTVLSLEEKFLAGEGQNITPARFGSSPEEYKTIASKVKSELKRAATVLKVEGYCRIDAFVRVLQDNTVQTIIIEVNSLPGMTPATCIYHQAAINGYKPYEFIDQILEYSFKRKHFEEHS